MTEDDIINRLSHWQRDEVLEDPFPPGFLSRPHRNASVLIPMLKKENAWHVLYIRRTANSNDPHSGQVAFPGGGADPGDDDAISTALREANEEIGLRPDDARVLGRLMDFITVTGYRVTPFVASIPWPYPLVLQANEVSRAFTIPLDWLANPANYEEHQRVLPEPYQPVSVIYYKTYEGETLWGASARFTLELIKLLFED